MLDSQTEQKKTVFAYPSWLQENYPATDHIIIYSARYYRETIFTKGETVCGFCGFLSSVRYGRPFHAAVIVITVLSRTGINGKMLKILRGNHMLVSKHVSGAVGVNLD